VFGARRAKRGQYFSEPSTTRRHGNFAGVRTLLRILLSSNSAVLIKRMYYAIFSILHLNPPSFIKSIKEIVYIIGWYNLVVKIIQKKFNCVEIGRLRRSTHNFHPFISKLILTTLNISLSCI
jgi:hypothetical protein